MLVREDRIVTGLVALWALTQLASIAWDLPCIYGWENDAVAPREVFAGLAANLVPGHGDSYPLLHYLLLATATWPIVLVSALTAQPFTIDGAVGRVLSVPALTAVAVVARVVAVAMSSISLLALARIARRTVSVPASRWAVAFAATNLTFSYYGRVSNLDGPYLMWVVLAVDRLLDVFERGEARDYHGLAVCAAASIATKDQAYAAYVVTLPFYLVLVPLWSRSSLAAGSRHFRLLAASAASGAFALALLGGGLLNPTGFVYRMQNLTGAASQDWRQYAPTLEGRLANVHDLAISQADFFWPWPVVILAWCGVAIALLPRADDAPLRTRSLRMLPAVAALSSTLAFTLVVARCEHRFVLPLGFWLSYYAGLGAASFTAIRSEALRSFAGAGLAVLLSFAAAHDFVLHVTEWGDARNEVERWLAQRPPGTVVETYGLGVYLPRFDLSANSRYRVQRVGPQALHGRAPIPGLREIQDAYGHVRDRAPDILVIPEAFVDRFLPVLTGPGLEESGERRKYGSDGDACTFFRSALADALPGYRLTFVAATALPGWMLRLGADPIQVQGSTGQRVWVLSRSDGYSGSSPAGGGA